MIVPRYGPGDWLAVVTDGHVCLLPPDVDLDTVTALWAAVREGAGLTAQLQLLLAGGLDALPPFALVALERDRVHVVVRGDVEVQVDADEPRTLRGRRVTTWHEDVVEGASRVVARVLDGSAGSDARLPVLSAVVRADVVAVDLRARRPARTAEEPAAADATPVPEGQAPEGQAPEAQAPEASAPPAQGAEGGQGRARSTEDGSTGARPTEDGPTGARSTGELEDLEHTVLHASTDTSVGLRLDLGGDVPAAPPVRRPVLARPPVEAPVEAPVEPRVPVVPQPSPGPDAPRVGREPVAPPAPPPTDAAPTEAAPTGPAPTDPAPTVAAPTDPWRTGPAPAGSSPTAPARPALVPSAGSAPDDADHDGTTVLSSDVVALRRQLPEWAGEGVPGPLAVPAPDRPAPAKIRLSSGLVVSLNRPVLLGRAPQVSRVSSREMPRLITVASPRQDISRTHAEVRMDGDDVLVTDLRSTNGVLLLRQGHGAQRLHPGEPTVVEPGVSVDLGEGVTFVVERGA